MSFRDISKILLTLMIVPAVSVILTGDEKPVDFTIGNITAAPGKMESGYLGNITQELRAPFTGIILYIIHTPPIVKGEPIFEVGRIKQE